MTDLGLKYLSKYVLGLLKTRPDHIDGLLTSLAKMTNTWNDPPKELTIVLKCLSLYPEQAREFLNALTSALVERTNQQNEDKIVPDCKFVLVILILGIIFKN